MRNWSRTRKKQQPRLLFSSDSPIGLLETLHKASRICAGLSRSVQSAKRTGLNAGLSSDIVNVMVAAEVTKHPRKTATSSKLQHDEHDENILSRNMGQTDIFTK